MKTASNYRSNRRRHNNSLGLCHDLRAERKKLGMTRREFDRYKEPQRREAAKYRGIR